MVRSRHTGTSSKNYTGLEDKGVEIEPLLSSWIECPSRASKLFTDRVCIIRDTLTLESNSNSNIDFSRFVYKHLTYLVTLMSLFHMPYSSVLLILIFGLK